MGKNTSYGMVGKRETLMWNPQMDDAFIQSLLKEQDNGNRIDGSFTPQAYTNMVRELSIILNKELTKNHLKNSLKTLKGVFSHWYDIFRGAALSGFAWNPETKLLEAENEVWEALIAEKPDAAKWKTKQISNYNEMLELFGKDRATGVATQTTKEINRHRVETIEEINEMISNNEIRLHNLNSGNELELVPTMSTPQTNPPKPFKSKSRKRKIEEEEAVTKQMMNSLNNIADVMKETNKVLEGARTHGISEEEIITELELIGLESNLMDDAYMYLADNRAKARTLFAYPPSRRMSLLLKMLGRN